MKKTTLIIAVLFAAVTTFAQDLTSKMGETYLPEAGEWAIGINASPVLNYFGNFIGGNGLNAAPTWTNNAYPNSSATNPVIYGKLFVDANTAYRGMVRLGFGSTKTTSMVQDLDPDAESGDMVENEVKAGNTGITIGAGLEKRKGNSRLQGVYGGQVMLGLGSTKTENTYGNSAEDSGVTAANPRPLEVKSGGTTTFGLAGFIGVEYFFCPKMSIGGEYTWGLGFSNTGAGETTSEFHDFAADDTETVTTEGTKVSSFGIDTGIFGSAALRLMFHF